MVERSREVPVVVDFWAAWCVPCRQLTPVLERAANERAGKVELAKVDVEANQRLQAAFRIQGIPAVKAFRDGRVAAEFTGALPPAEVERFFDALVPSQADELVAGGDEDSLRRALELDPSHATARRELGKLLLRRGDTVEAAEVLEAARGDFVADGLVARVELGDDEALAHAFEAWDVGDPAAGVLRAASGGLRERGGQLAQGPHPPRDGRDIHGARPRRPARSRASAAAVHRALLRPARAG